MTHTGHTHKDPLAQLRSENEALDEQVKLLVQTEQRLYRSQNELDRQLARIQRLSELALLLSGHEDPQPILQVTCDMLVDTFDVDRLLCLQLDGQSVVSQEGKDLRVPGPVVRILGGLELQVQVLPGEVPESLRRWLLPSDLVDAGGVVASLPLRPFGESRRVILLWKVDGNRASFHRETLRPKHVPYLQILATHVIRAMDSAALTRRLRERGQELAESNAMLKSSLSQLESTQERLVRAQKLEAIGRLAGGVAHDFNNILTVISTHAGILRRTLPRGSAERQDVEQIRIACDRAAKITRQLLAFGRKQKHSQEVVDLNATIIDMSTMLGRLVGENVSLQLRLAPVIPPIHVDRTQLEQMLVNLVVNARDAMPEGGVVTVCTRSPRLEDAMASAEGVDLREHVVLTVSDTGQGMDASTRKQVFEPFFTTKPPGQGTGMGLATVYGTVKQNRGHISIDTRPGEGTCFTILLPIPTPNRPITPAPQASGGPSAATVLLVEDEDAIRRSVTRVLQSRGYRVLQAGDGREALTVAEAAGGEVDLLVTDVVMPQMDGVALARELTLRRKGLPVVFMSGHPFDMLDTEGMEGARYFLQKPFELAELLELVGNAVGEAVGG